MEESCRSNRNSSLIMVAGHYGTWRDNPDEDFSWPVPNQNHSSRSSTERQLIQEWQRRSWPAAATATTLFTDKERPPPSFNKDVSSRSSLTSKTQRNESQESLDSSPSTFVRRQSTKEQAESPSQNPALRSSSCAPNLRRLRPKTPVMMQRLPQRLMRLCHPNKKNKPARSLSAEFTSPQRRGFSMITEEEQATIASSVLSSSYDDGCNGPLVNTSLHRQKPLQDNAPRARSKSCFASLVGDHWNHHQSTVSTPPRPLEEDRQSNAASPTRQNRVSHIEIHDIAGGRSVENDWFAEGWSTNRGQQQQEDQSSATHLVEAEEYPTMKDLLAEARRGVMYDLSSTARMQSNEQQEEEAIAQLRFSSDPCLQELEEEGDGKSFSSRKHAGSKKGTAVDNSPDKIGTNATSAESFTKTMGKASSKPIPPLKRRPPATRVTAKQLRMIRSGAAPSERKPQVSDEILFKDTCLCAGKVLTTFHLGDVDDTDWNLMEQQQQQLLLQGGEQDTDIQPRQCKAPSSARRTSTRVLDDGGYEGDCEPLSKQGRNASNASGEEDKDADDSTVSSLSSVSRSKTTCTASLPHGKPIHGQDSSPLGHEKKTVLDAKHLNHPIDANKITDLDADKMTAFSYAKNAYYYNKISLYRVIPTGMVVGVQNEPEEDGYNYDTSRAVDPDDDHEDEEEGNSVSTISYSSQDFSAKATVQQDADDDGEERIAAKED